MEGVASVLERLRRPRRDDVDTRVAAAEGLGHVASHERVVGADHGEGRRKEVLHARAFPQEFGRPVAEARSCQLRGAICARIGQTSSSTVPGGTVLRITTLRRPSRRGHGRCGERSADLAHGTLRPGRDRHVRDRTPECRRTPSTMPASATAASTSVVSHASVPPCTASLISSCRPVRRPGSNPR